jgi:broad specificity phosphatase PhoE
LAVTLLLVRHAPHGQLGTALSGRTAGLALSAEGASLAARLGDRLAGQGIDLVQASPLDRTMETARAIASAAGVSVEPVDALNEVDFGEWTGRDFGDLAGDPLWEEWNRTRGSASAPGGESMVAAQARIVAHLQAVARDRDGKTVAMVSHCDMIRAAVAWVLGLSLDNLLRIDIDPASVTRIVLGDWGGRIMTLNKGIW